MLDLDDIPDDFPVQPIETDDEGNVIGPVVEPIATCGACGLSWDDGRVTDWTPAPSARCPFEYFHIRED